MDVLSIVARLRAYQNNNYLRPYYIEQLKSKNRYALHQLPLPVVLEIICRERMKAFNAYNKEIRETKESLTLDQRINSSSYWTFVKNTLKHRRKLADDRYMVSFLIENLQEYTEDGKNVTYEGMNLYGED